ncbi:unnamed protein product, partial [marine sediment metagenome]
TTLALSLTEYAPTVLTPRLLTPTTLALLLTTYAPNLIVGEIFSGSGYGSPIEKSPTSDEYGSVVDKSPLSWEYVKNRGFTHIFTFRFDDNIYPRCDEGAGYSTPKSKSLAPGGYGTPT